MFDEQGSPLDTELLSRVKRLETMEDPFSVVPGFFRQNPARVELDQEFLCKLKKPGDELNWRSVPCDLITPGLHQVLGPLVEKEVDFAQVKIFETDRLLLAPVWRTFLPLYRPESEYDVRDQLYGDERFETTQTGRYVEAITSLWTPALRREELKGVNMALIDDYCVSRIFSEEIKSVIESFSKIQMEFKEIRILEEDGSVTGSDFMFD